MILIVDDDSTALKTARRALEGDGYQVEAFSEPYRAIAFVAQDVPDLILCEIRMFEMSGFDFLHTYRTRFPGRETPFIFVSALGRPEQIVRGLDKGVDDYLLKPIDAGVLCAKVRSHLRRASRFGIRVVRGQLYQLSFPSLVRECEKSGLTGTLEITSDDLHAAIRFSGGRLDEDSIPDHVLEKLFDLAGGRFAIVSVPAAPPAIMLATMATEELTLTPEEEDLFRAQAEETPAGFVEEPFPVLAEATRPSSDGAADAAFPEAPPEAPPSLPSLESRAAGPAVNEGEAPPVVALRAPETVAPEALPGGVLSGVQVGGKLFQVQTEVIEGAPRRIITVATYHGKTLLRRDTACADCTSRHDLQRLVTAQHLDLEGEVRQRVEGFLSATRKPGSSPTPPSFEDLYQQGAEMLASGDIPGALALWEEAAQLDPTDKLLARRIELLRSRVAGG
ncbi:MAG TPA: response regulator [Thermoanaerobaculaceae bacterium]|nr:response regulator [Thermoanaerobaculaceae bacterium]HPS77092.1 response regulator [Thermoanaerobaculaceae bacterium]